MQLGLSLLGCHKKTRTPNLSETEKNCCFKSKLDCIKFTDYMTKIINGNTVHKVPDWSANHTVHHRQELQAEADEQNTNLPRCPTRSMLLMSSRGGGEEGSGAVFRGIPLDNCISSTSVSVKLLYKIARPTIYFKLVKAKEWDAFCIIKARLNWSKLNMSPGFGA